MSKKTLFLILIIFLAYGCNQKETKQKNSTTQEPTTTIETTTVEPELTLTDYMDAFKKAGLNVLKPQKMTREDLGYAPLVTDEMYIFGVLNSPGDVDLTVKNGEYHNCRIFIVDNNEDRKLLKKYYDDLGKQSAALYSHTYEKGKFLIQMSGDVPDEIFDLYKQIIDNPKLANKSDFKKYFTKDKKKKSNQDSKSSSNNQSSTAKSEESQEDVPKNNFPGQGSATPPPGWEEEPQIFYDENDPNRPDGTYIEGPDGFTIPIKPDSAYGPGYFDEPVDPVPVEPTPY